MDGPFITKGARIRAQWLQANDPPSSLAGMQLKFGCTSVEVIGTCVHFRGDDPVNPKEVRIYIDVEGELPKGVKKVVPPGCTHDGGHVEIHPDWVKGVL